MADPERCPTCNDPRLLAVVAAAREVADIAFAVEQRRIVRSHLHRPMQRLIDSISDLDAEPDPSARHRHRVRVTDREPECLAPGCPGFGALLVRTKAES